MTVGDRIREIRIKEGKTQEEVAKLINTTKQTIYKYENNIVTNIPLDKLESIAKILNTTPAYLMGWAEPISEDKRHNNSDVSNNDSENSPSLQTQKKIALLARHLDEIPEDKREKIIKNFEDTIDMYLEAMGIDKGEADDT